MSSFQEYWDAIPTITRAHLTGSVLMTALSALGIVDLGKMIFLPQAVQYKFEIWRLFTNFFVFGKFSFAFIMQMMLLGRFGSQVENEPFRTPNGDKGDYIFSLILMGSELCVLGYFLELVVLGPSLVFALVYLWSRKNPDAPISVWGFRFAGSNLPWVFIAFTVLTGGSPVPDLCGLFVGHVYYFLVEVLPLKYQRAFIKTPGIIKSLAQALVGNEMGGYGGPQEAAPQRHAWGTGRRLD